MLKEPVLNEDKLKKVKLQINHIKENIVKHNRDKQDVLQQLDLLNHEYEQQIEIRSQQIKSLESQWKSYQLEQKKNRKKEIDRRQIEFNKELDMEYQKNIQEHSVDYQPLLDFLTQAELNQVTIVQLPMHLLELCWSLNITVPVFTTEIPSTLEQLKKIIQVSL